MPPASPKTDAARRLFEVVGTRGLTWQEYAAASGGHHGSASAMLTKLHQRGEIARLTEKRQGSGVYVLPENLDGRETTTGRKPKAKPAAPINGVDFAVLLNAFEAVSDLQLTAASVFAEASLEVQMAAEMDRMVTEREAERKRIEQKEQQEKADRKLQSDLLAELNKRHASDMAKAVRDASEKAREEAAATAWQEGYDSGVERGQASAADGEGFANGREVGRREGEEFMTRRVAGVSTELYRVIVESTPIRTHFNGCYRIHSECAVRAVAQSAGVMVRPRGSVPRAS